MVGYYCSGLQKTNKTKVNRHTNDVYELLGNFRFATATKSSTTTRFLSSNFFNQQRFFTFFIYMLRLCKHSLVEPCTVVVSF